MKKSILTAIAIVLITAASVHAGMFDDIIGEMPPDPIPASGTWSDYNNLQDSGGQYWQKIGYNWKLSDKTTYDNAQALDKMNEATNESYHKAYDKCLAKRVKGEETKEGIKAIRRVCRTKGEKAREKSIKWYKRRLMLGLE